MGDNPDQITNIPTNMITGFLGAGKTTAILHLLKNKPQNERWAVLVNEFGEVGIDGQIIKGQHSEEEQGVYIKEVPGGCMCCTAGAPMKVALNQLLKHSKPDRLLIEPTGLGHPIEVIETLTSKYFEQVIDLQKVITLIDARNVSDKRYTEHSTFNQQLSIADHIIGNKNDLCTESDRNSLLTYAQKHGKNEDQVYFTENGIITTELLSNNPKKPSKPHRLTNKRPKQEPPTKADNATFSLIKPITTTEEFKTTGLKLTLDMKFNYLKLINFFGKIKAERVKAVLNTNKGAIAFNLSSDILSETPLKEIKENRIEIIAREIDESWEEKFRNCEDKPED